MNHADEAYGIKNSGGINFDHGHDLMEAPTLKHDTANRDDVETNSKKVIPWQTAT